MDISPQTLGKDQFLELFTKQLQFQDPLNPMDSAAFTAELAQFSQVEQLFNMNESLDALLDYQGSLNNGLSTNLIGRLIAWDAGGGKMSGTVTGLSFGDGMTYLMTDTGHRVALGEITEIMAAENLA